MERCDTDSADEVELLWDERFNAFTDPPLLVERFARLFDLIVANVKEIKVKYVRPSLLWVVCRIVQVIVDEWEKCGK